MNTPIFFRSLQAIYGDDSNVVKSYKMRSIFLTSHTTRQKRASPVYDLTIHNVPLKSSLAFVKWKMSIDLLGPLRLYTIIDDENSNTNIKCLFDEKIEAQRFKKKVLSQQPHLTVTIEDSTPFVTV